MWRMHTSRNPKKTHLNAESVVVVYNGGHKMVTVIACLPSCQSACFTNYSHKTEGQSTQLKNYTKSLF